MKLFYVFLYSCVCVLNLFLVLVMSVSWFCAFSLIAVDIPLLKTDAGRELRPVVTVIEVSELYLGQCMMVRHARAWTLLSLF